MTGEGQRSRRIQWKARSKEWLYRRLLASGVLSGHKYFPVDQRGLIHDPAAGFQPGRPLPFLVEVPLDHCRILRGLAFPGAQRTGNPFVEALLAYGESNRMEDACALLRRFYARVQPADAGSLLGIQAPPTPLLAQPAFCYVYPWDPLPSSSVERSRRRAILREDAGHGASSGFQGWHHFGPVTEAKVELETRRLVAVYNSIREHGFQRRDGKDGDIEGLVLVAQAESRLLIKRGHHRIAALVALGYSTVAVRCGCYRNALIRREQVAHWAGVGEGGYTTAEALQVFDRIHAGRQPPVASGWLAPDQRQC